MKGENMDDLTIIQYTANRIEETFASNIRKELLSHNIPIISVSHKPMDFGTNICVGNIGVSVYNVYLQILIGAREAKTEYVMCAEDDALYSPEHLAYRPANDTFSYNYRWLVNKDHFLYRNRANMCTCVAPTALMVETLETRFKKFPTILSAQEMGAIGGFGEPGRFEDRYGLPKVKMEVITLKHQTLTFNHYPSLGGVRKRLPRDIVETELPFWGKASDLWRKIHGVG